MEVETEFQCEKILKYIYCIYYRPNNCIFARYLPTILRSPMSATSIYTFLQCLAWFSYIQKNIE